MYNKKRKELEEKQNIIIERLGQSGIKVTKGSKKPKNASFSGIVGEYPKTIIILPPNGEN